MLAVNNIGKEYQIKFTVWFFSLILISCKWLRGKILLVFIDILISKVCHIWYLKWILDFQNLSHLIFQMTLGSQNFFVWFLKWHASLISKISRFLLLIEHIFSKFVVYDFWKAFLNFDLLKEMFDFQNQVIWYLVKSFWIWLNKITWTYLSKFTDVQIITLLIIQTYQQCPLAITFNSE